MARSARVNVPVGPPVRLDDIPGEADREYGVSLLIFNPGADVVELGGPDVSGVNSFRGLVAGASAGVDLAEGESFYARVDTVAGSVDVLRVK